MFKGACSVRLMQFVGIILTSLILTGHSQASDRKIDLTSDARNFVDWIVHTADHQNLPFIVVDKKAARVFVYRGDGTLLGAASALLGVTQGDDTSPEVGKKKLADIRKDERTTPAGRFVADLGLDLQNSEILWIDYDSGLSLHIVITANASEQRLKRLASKQVADLRITYGCINVSKQFYIDIVYPTFKNTSGIVYILPEVHSIQKVFGQEAARFAQR
ncbi:hypothetical protein [Zwartia sp.]|uniref:hypothetical protein n=1 Tax=Zwartia sp. TaxID=2978004 RepID=UPI002725CD2F|nr:hypothetical protein [Zwartia sp.]MDO9024144.1 hypothetical protein [Zwartia sp.]